MCIMKVKCNENGPLLIVHITTIIFYPQETSDYFYSLTDILILYFLYTSLPSTVG